MHARRPRAPADRPLADDRRHHATGTSPSRSSTTGSSRRGLARIADERVHRGDPGDRRRRASAAAGRRTTRRSRRPARTSTWRGRRSPTSSCARRSRARSACRPRPSSQIRLFYGAYADVLITAVQGRARGAVARQPPRRIRPGRVGRRPRSSACPPRSPRRSPPASARSRSRRLDEALPLGAVPLESARPAIRTTLLSFARTQAYEDAARKRAESALNRTTCLRDDLPNPAVVAVSTYLPFLALSS